MGLEELKKTEGSSPSTLPEIQTTELDPSIQRALTDLKKTHSTTSPIDNQITEGAPKGKEETATKAEDAYVSRVRTTTRRGSISGAIQKLVNMQKGSSSLEGMEKIKKMPDLFEAFDKKSEGLGAEEKKQLANALLDKVEKRFERGFEVAGKYEGENKSYMEGHYLVAVYKERHAAIPESPEPVTHMGAGKILSAELQRAIDQRNLKVIATHVAGVAGGVTFKTLDESLNPVTKLDVQFFIKKADIPAEQSISRTELQKGFTKELQEYMKNPENSANSKQALKEALGEIQGFLRKSEQGALSEDEIKTVKQTIERFKQEVAIEEELKGKGLNETESKKVFDLLSKLETVLKTSNAGIDLSGVSIHYDKQEAIDALQLTLVKENADLEKLLNQEDKFRAMPGIKKQLHRKTLSEHKREMGNADPKALEEKADRILQAIRQIRESKGETLSQADLDSLPFTLKLAEYVSSADVMAKNKQDPVVMAKLKTAAGQVETPSYAYKTGLENEREMVAQKALKAAGLDRYIVPKMAQKMEGARLAGQNSPEGIGSRWIDGLGVNTQEWKDYKAARKAFEAKLASGDNPIREKRAMNQAAEKLMEKGGHESIVDQIVIDMMFGANDSHINQYKVGADGELYNFDFAQFMNPHFAYSDGGQTLMTLRSALLDHPIVKASMNDPDSPALAAMKEKLLSMDGDALVANWEAEGLVGTPEFFKSQEKKMGTLIEDNQRCNRAITGKEEALAIAEKHGIKINPNQPEAAVKKAVSDAIVKQYFGAKKECIQKIHPKAVEQMQSRLKGAQEYLKTSQNPTLQGTWDAYYPELQVFKKVLERMEVSASENMGVRRIAQEEKKLERSEIAALKESPKAESTDKKGVNPELKAKFKRAVQTAAERYGKGDNQAMKNQYSAEFLDPKHRYGADILPFFQVWSGEAGITDNFATWITKLDQGESVPGSQLLQEKGLLTPAGTPIEMRTVQYLSEAERGAYRLQVNEKGEFYTEKNGLLNSSGELSHIFVEGPDGNIYVNEYTQGSFNHSSFFAGGPVKNGGRMEFKNGKLLVLQDHSGHYWPTNAMTLTSLRTIQKQFGEPAIKNLEVRFRERPKMGGLEAMRFLQANEDKKIKEPIQERRSLESVIVQAKKQGMATPEEIQQMISSLRTIQAECSTLAEVRTVNASL